MKREEHKDRIRIRHEKWKEQKGICVYCKKQVKPDKASLDHIIPVIRLDDMSDDSNLVVCCKSCNVNKGDHIIFTNMYDKEIYPMVDIPYIFHANRIIKNYRDQRKTK